jgi:hypothetical protein
MTEIKLFYKFDEQNLITGGGIVVPDDCTEYQEGSEPQDLKDALVIRGKEQVRANSKALVAETVKNLEVTYKTVTYQADEASQDRISRAISSGKSVKWLAKDNTVHNLITSDLVAILTSALDAQEELLMNNNVTPNP